MTDRMKLKIIITTITIDDVVLCGRNKYIFA